MFSDIIKMNPVRDNRNGGAWNGGVCTVDVGGIMNWWIICYVNIECENRGVHENGGGDWKWSMKRWSWGVGLMLEVLRSGAV